MNWSLAGDILLAILISGVILVIISDKRDAGRKAAWIFIIAVLPILGIILYLLFGTNPRHHWIFNRKHRNFTEEFVKGAEKPLIDRLFGHDDEKLLKEEYMPLTRFLDRQGIPTLSRGNDVEIITSGARKYELIMRDLENAKESIHIEYFHFGNDKGGRAVRDLLMKKAREGVKVRFINENIANFPIMSRYYDKMREAGVEVLKFTNPRWAILTVVTNLNYRDHRKILVIDGKIGYTGGMNINDNYFKLWRDTHMRLTGPAVTSLQYMFLDVWMTAGGRLDKPLMDFFPSLDPHAEKEPETGRPILRDKLLQIVPDEPDSTWPMLQMALEWAVTHAKKYIWMQTPYFVPAEPILNAMKVTAMSGVDVRLMLPRKADEFFMRPVNESYYNECLEAGVKIYLRGGEFIHSKTFVSDDYLSSIGTANIDCRSYDLDYEVNTFIYDEEAAIACKAIFEEDMKLCEEISFEQWQKRPWYKRLMEYIMRLFAPLL